MKQRLTQWFPIAVCRCAGTGPNCPSWHFVWWKKWTYLLWNMQKVPETCQDKPGCLDQWCEGTSKADNCVIQVQNCKEPFVSCLYLHFFELVIAELDHMWCFLSFVPLVTLQNEKAKLMWIRVWHKTWTHQKWSGMTRILWYAWHTNVLWNNQYVLLATEETQSRESHKFAF